MPILTLSPPMPPTPTTPLTLGQSGSMSSMIIWILVLIGVALAGGLVIFALRRRMLSQDEQASAGPSGLLEHLRGLHKSGELNDEEFARAREAVLRQVQESMESRKAAQNKPTPSILDDLEEFDMDR